jgi:hypothetical protein
LAHELTHVVQQRSVRPLDDKFAERLEISRVPTRLMSRLGPESDEEERKKEAEDPRNKAIKRHEEQQRRVVEYLDKARKIQPDPKKGFSRPRQSLSQYRGVAGRW